jgi:hypothetical protein
MLITWSGLISYLYFLENIFAIEIFIANDTIAILSALPNNSGNKNIGGSFGKGILSIRKLINICI